MEIIRDGRYFVDYKKTGRLRKSACFFSAVFPKYNSSICNLFNQLKNMNINARNINSVKTRPRILVRYP